MTIYLTLNSELRVMAKKILTAPIERDELAIGPTTIPTEKLQIVALTRKLGRSERECRKNERLRIRY